MSAPLHPERIVLTGFMGSGKTTVGRLLATHLGWSFLDLDDAIAARAGLTIPQIFAVHGEPAFRDHESAALGEALTRTHLVLALGGGAPETPVNRDLLTAAAATSILYLAAPFAELHTRCKMQSEDPHATPRPLFADPTAAAARFAQREPLYRALAHLSVDTSAHTPAALATHILQALNFAC